jgi:hypothetical protein
VNIEHRTSSGESPWDGPSALEMLRWVSWAFGPGWHEVAPLALVDKARIDDGGERSMQDAEAGGSAVPSGLGAFANYPLPGTESAGLLSVAPPGQF